MVRKEARKRAAGQRADCTWGLKHMGHSIGPKVSQNPE